MLATFLSVPAGIGYLGVFLLVAGETAGALVPGETALIVAGAVAARGNLSLPLVIGAGAAGAIAGDNVGFLIGERGVRLLLTRGRRWRPQRTWLANEAGRFFARHGPRAVFLARWLPGLRLFGAWFAGAARMRWRVFLAWNALGGVAWAASVGGGAYVLGRAADWALGLVGLVLTVTMLVLAGVLLARRRLERASAAAQYGSLPPTRR